MQEDWEPVMFNTSKYKDTGLTILSAVDDIQTILDDHIVKTQTMKGSPFIKPFEEEIKVSSVLSRIFSDGEGGGELFSGKTWPSRWIIHYM